MANPNDPLPKFGAPGQRELFGQFTKVANGFSTEDVIGAAANLMVNAIRQAQPTRQKAEASYDELFGQIKSLLVSHYDSLGRKRGLFAYDQVIEVPYWDSRKKG